MISRAEIFRSPFCVTSLTCILIFCSVMGLRLAGFLEHAELTAYDWFVRLQPRKPPSDSRIVLVTITEEDIRSLGKWPLSDATMARLLSELIRQRPRVIGLDVYRDVSIPPGREELESVLSENPNVVAVMKFGGGGSEGISPPPALNDTEQVGFNDILVDPGGVVRRGLLFLDDGVNVFHSFALRLALLYLHAEGITARPDPSNPHHIRLGETTIRPFEANDGGYIRADARGYQFLLDYNGVGGGFPSVALMSVLSGDMDANAMRDRLVLIGVTAEGVKDIFYTPLSRGVSGSQQTSGIELHALIVDQLLRAGLEGRAAVRSISGWSEGGWILLWCLTGGVVGLGVRSPWRFSLAAAGGLAMLGLAGYVVLLWGWWIPTIPSAMTWLISATVLTAYMSNQEKRQRGILMQLLSRHVSPEVAEAIWQQRDQFLAGGRLRSQRLTATVLFTDLIGFTAVSERLHPQTLMDWLNEYMEAMAQQVVDHRGVINKYIGDAIMAVFGVPLPRDSEAEIRQDAVNAVNCALAMERKLAGLNRLWQQRDLPTTGMRIGIFTGPVIAGSLGSARRLEYTVMGDTVNTASRLEGFDKEHLNAEGRNPPCRILVGETTLHYLGDRFKTRRIGKVHLKGKVMETAIHKVIGRHDDPAEPNAQEVRR